MSTIQAVLREEYERLQKLQKRYEKDIKALPSGSVSIKKRKGRTYAYRAYRDHEKVKTDYIGPVDSDAVKEIKELIGRRKEFEELLRATRKKLTELKRVVK